MTKHCQTIGENWEAIVKAVWIQASEMTKVTTGRQYIASARQVHVCAVRGPAPQVGSNLWKEPPLLHSHWLNAFYCRTHGTCSCARACVWSLFGSFFLPSAANKPPVSDGYSPSLLLRGETFPRGGESEDEFTFEIAETRRKSRKTCRNLEQEKGVLASK